MDSLDHLFIIMSMWGTSMTGAATNLLLNFCLSCFQSSYVLHLQSSSRKRRFCWRSSCTQKIGIQTDPMVMLHLYLVGTHFNNVWTHHLAPFHSFLWCCVSFFFFLHHIFIMRKYPGSRSTTMAGSLLSHGFDTVFFSSSCLFRTIFTTSSLQENIPIEKR